MNIGIITQRVGNNYGGILQNWALQQVLKGMGHKPVTIDSDRRYPYYRWLFSYSRVKIERLFGKNSNYLPKRPIKGRTINEVTAPFIFDNIEMSRPYKRLSESIVKKEKLDAIIVGSDQVWRPKYNSHLSEMFLSFLSDKKTKRIAYAASFGSDEWEMNEEQTETCKRLLQLFDWVSVRESNGVDLCKTYFDRDAELVLDPTLLINGDVYAKLCDQNSTPDKPYLAYYCLDASPEKVKQAELIAQKRNLEIKYIIDGNSLSYSVPEWLNMLREASFVLTDSFHGTVFSILFHKPFLTFNNVSRGQGRFLSLFDVLGIKNHLINTDELDNISNYDVELDWQEVMEKLEMMRKTSFDFLNKSLSVSTNS